MRLMTVRGYQLSDCASALQKAIRRGDARIAGYFAVEMFEANYAEYVWRRLLTVSAEDCAGIITQEIESLYRSWQIIHKQRKGAGRIFIAKAVIVLCEAKKSRDADHLTNLVHDSQSRMPDEKIERILTAARSVQEPIPDYAFDCHTSKGKRAGKMKKQFFLEEQDALNPRRAGLFDEDLEDLRRGRVALAD